jgi:hypothetical protein
VRRANVIVSPFAMTCEMSLYYARLPYEEKGDTRTRGASRIRSSWPRIFGPVLSLTTLSNFLKPPSALALLLP